MYLWFCYGYSNDSIFLSQLTDQFDKASIINFAKKKSLKIKKNLFKKLKTFGDKSHLFEAKRQQSAAVQESTFGLGQATSPEYSLFNYNFLQFLTETNF